MQDARHRSMNHLAREASRDGRILSLREQEYLIDLLRRADSCQERNKGMG